MTIKIWSMFALIGIAFGILATPEARAQTTCPLSAIVLNSIPYGKGAGNSSLNCMVPAANGIVATNGSGVPSIIPQSSFVTSASIVSYGAVANDPSKAAINKAAFLAAFAANPYVVCPSGQVFYTEAVLPPPAARYLGHCNMIAAGSISSGDALINITMNTSGVTIEDNDISVDRATYPGVSAIIIDHGSTKFVINNNRISSSRVGIWALGGSTGGVISNNTVTGFSSIGIQIGEPPGGTGTEQITIINNVVGGGIPGSFQCIISFQSNWIRIANNFPTGCLSFGIAAVASAGVSVTGNVVSDTQPEGIHMDATSQFSVTGNVVRYSTTGVDIGMSFSNDGHGGVSDGIIAGNTVVNSCAAGIALAGIATGVSVTANTVINPNQCTFSGGNIGLGAGILLYGTAVQNNSVAGNFVYDTSGLMTYQIFEGTVGAETDPSNNYIFTNSGAVGTAGLLSIVSRSTGNLYGDGIFLNGSTSGTLTMKAPAAAGTSQITWPAGTTNFSSTGGTSQVVKQVSAGAPFTVGRLACADLSDAGAGCSGGSGTGAITALNTDVVATGPGAAAATIQPAAVTYAKIQNIGALAVMGRSTNSGGVGADIQATAASGAVLRESGSTIGWGTIATAGIANNAVTLAKLATQGANTILGNATSGAAVPTALTMPSCSTAASAVSWTTNTGFGCNTSVTAASVPVSGLTGAGTGVLTALAVNVGSAGAFVTFNGALGTPSSGTLTNATGLPTTGLTGTLQAAQEPAHTGDVTNSAGSLALTIAANAVTLAKLATQATNTVLGNATAGSAVPTALSVGTCSTSASALIWTTNTGFGCNTAINAATLGGATFASPGNIGTGTPGTGAFSSIASGQQVITAANNGDAVEARSGNSANFVGISVGRTATEGNFAAAAANDQFITGTVAGDVALRGTAGLWLAGSSTPGIHITTGGGISMLNLPASAGGGGLSLCIDTAGVLYKKATCP